MSNNIARKTARIEEAIVEKIRYFRSVPFLICRCEDPEIHSVDTPIELLTTVKMVANESDVNSSSDAGFPYVPSEGERILITFTNTVDFSEAYFYGIIYDPYSKHQIKTRPAAAPGSISKFTKGGAGYSFGSKAELYSTKSKLSVGNYRLKFNTNTTDYFQIDETGGMQFFSYHLRSSFIVNKKVFVGVDCNIELFSKSGAFKVRATNGEFDFRGGTYQLNTSTISETSQKRYMSDGVFKHKVASGLPYGSPISWDTQILEGDAALTTCSGDIILHAVTPGLSNIQLAVGPIAVPLGQLHITDQSILLKHLTGTLDAEALQDISIKSNAGKVNVSALQDITIDSSTGKIEISGLQEIVLKLTSGAKIEITPSHVLIDGVPQVKLGGDVSIAQAVITKETDPVADYITGKPHQGSSYVFAKGF